MRDTVMNSKPCCTTGFRTWSLRSRNWNTWSLSSNVALHSLRICARRGGAVMMSPVGVHQAAGASSAKSDRARSAFAALGRVEQEIEGASVQIDGTSMFAPPEVQGIRETRRRSDAGDRSTSKAIGWHTQASSPKINPAALPQSLYMAALEDRSEVEYSREYPPHP